MKVVKAVGVMALFAMAAAYGQSGDFVTSGKVVDINNQPIAGATVSYLNFAKRLSWDFSKGDGSFGASSAVLPRGRVNPAVTFAAAGPVTVEVYDVTGKQISSTPNVKIDKGTYSLLPVGKALGRSMYVVKIKAGANVCYQKLINTGLQSRLLPAGAVRASSGAVALSKTLAAIDSVRVGKTGYTPQVVPVTSYGDNVGTIKLTPIDIDGQVDAVFAAMAANEKTGQCLMPSYPTDANTAVTNRIGNMFGGGGAFATSTPTALANYIDSIQTAMVGRTPRKVPILLAYDGVHGMDVMPGGTIFPHNMGMGAIQDSNLVMKGFRVAAMEMRGTGANWTFGPCIAVVRDDRWGRSYEGFSESPDLTVKMARWAVLGLQTSDLSHPWNVAATTKHFAGDGGSLNGINPGQTVGPDDATAAPIHLPGYVSAVEAGTAAIMPSFSRWWDGTFMHGNTRLLTGWLKEGATVGGVVGTHFDGFVVGDWNGHLAAGGVGPSMNAGLDVPMITTGAAVIPAGARSDDACKRVLRVKLRMNLPNQYLVDRRLTDSVGCAGHRAVARACVRASLVLLKNQNSALPIPKTASVHVCGPAANDIGIQCGGWTVTWQGMPGPTTPGTTILQGVQRIAGAAGVTPTTSPTGATIGTSEYVIACLSEGPYAEAAFSHISLKQGPASSGDTATITNIKAAHAAGKKVIVVLMAGRMLDISPIINDCDAFVWASLPGTEGDGIPEVLYREKADYNFAGKLPLTWPTDLSQEPINVGDGKTGLYPFGAGLSYPN